MKRLGIYLIAVSLTASILVSCKKQETRQGPVDRGGGTAATVPSQGAIMAKDEYARNIETKLGELAERVNVLKENAKRSASSSKKEVDDRINALDKELESAKNELNEIRKSDHSADEVRARLDKRINDIDKHLSDTAASIR